ncbi:MAG: RND family efflux transporter MFP subunit [Halomonas sp. 54_146]|nr:MULTISPECIES: efflux RND transporter periplasmic adaptor subunit [unclassified Halomonas]KUJ87750.1 MAG: RND family efflux transporter MFP subunit [Halomonas sp. 54_146]
MNYSTPLRIAKVLPLAALLLAGCGQTAEQIQVPRTPEVGVYTVEAKPLTLTTALPGRTSAYRVAEVRPQVTGILQERLFTEGSEVEKNQQLYQIDPRTYEARLARAEANLKAAENLAKRYERLLNTNAISRQQYDDAMAAWKQAQAEVQVARIDVQYTEVLAPISGQVGRSAVTEGALVTNGQPQELATVTQLDPIYVDVNQPITRMLGLRRALDSGQLQTSGEDQANVTLTLDDGSAYPLPGVLKFSEVTVDPSTGAVTLRAEFPNPKRTLLPGMFVQAQLQEGIQDNAILVPQQAVFRDSRGVANAWVIENGVAKQRELETLRTVGNSWLIGSGIENGDQVVTEGLQQLRNGMQVTTAPATNVNTVTEFGQPDNQAAN